MRVDTQEGKLIRQLTLFDAVMFVVTGTVGASIFIIPADVLRAVPSPMFALLLWVVAGGITLLAGLACAELGGMFPESGGQYVFIREAYGRPAGFMYGWVLFTAGNSGGLAAMVISFAMFLGRAFPVTQNGRRHPVRFFVWPSLDVHSRVGRCHWRACVAHRIERAQRSLCHLPAKSHRTGLSGYDRGYCPAGVSIRSRLLGTFHQAHRQHRFARRCRDCHDRAAMEL